MVRGALLACAFAAGCAASAGRFEHRYPDGQLRIAGPTRNGRLHGEVTTWRASGAVETRGTYRDGVRHGLFLVYDDSGTVVIRRAVYQQNRLVWRTSDPRAEVPAALAATVEPVEQEEERAEGRRVQSPPSFAATDPVQGRTGADARMDLVFPASGDSVGIRVAAGGELYWRDLGGYARITTSEHRGDEIDRTSGKTVLDAGVLHRWWPGKHIALVRVGAFVPVANDDPEAFAADKGIAFSGVRDAAYHLPRVTGLRASASVLRRIGPVFGRMDGGVDYAQTIADEDDVPRLAGSDVVVRSSIAGGALQGPVIAALELAMAATYREAIDAPLTSAITLHVPLDVWLVQSGVFVPLTGDDAGDAFAVVLGVTRRAE